LVKRDIYFVSLQVPSDLIARTESCINVACERLTAADTLIVYFRADDIAVPGAKFFRMMELFSNYRVPLSLAVVPAWLTAQRWNALRRSGQGFSSLWCWHQHGWRHINHESAGRSQEFGPARLQADIKDDLLKGKCRLENIIGDNFYPVFTPPWNRCNLQTLELLKRCGFSAVSRNCKALPPAPHTLPDFCVDIDLHTRKVLDPASEWSRFFEELTEYLSSGRCGIMIHHRKMNKAAFDFLEILLKILKRHKRIRLVNFKNLAETQSA
jgi:peptidoglycan/xylan/chitin deacetylase (PgdA/CDA1 family)